MGALNHSVWWLIQIDQPRSLLRRRRPPPPLDRRTWAPSVLAPGNPSSRSFGTGCARGDDDSDGRPAPLDIYPSAVSCSRAPVDCEGPSNSGLPWGSEMAR